MYEVGNFVLFIFRFNLQVMRDPKYFYDTQENVTDEGIQYTFISEGIIDIFKVIEYVYVRDFLGKKLYNLGFGDYDVQKGVILDGVISNNGDHYRIFNTVLNTIPIFFENYPNAIMIVQGSDSGPENTGPMLTGIMICWERSMSF